MTRVELDNKLRRYADAQALADNAGTDAEWAPLSDTATALAIEILNEFDRTIAERDRLRAEVRRTRPVYVRAMRYCRLRDGWNPEHDPDGDRHGNALCWLEDACRWARRKER